jgi:hypothetical protein
MLAKTVFFSWMSDLPSGCNRTLIEEAVQLVFNEREKEHWHLDERIDEATEDVQGAVDIVGTLLRKIDLCSIFIADVTPINTGAEVKRRTPNPNVMFELGYAVNVVGWENIILIFNKAYGDINDLPFDIKGKRVFDYTLKSGSVKKDERVSLANALKKALDVMLDNEPHTATIKTFIKLEVDYQLMEIGNHLYKLVHGPSPLLMPEHILEMTAMDANAITMAIQGRRVLGFRLLKSWEGYITELKAVKNNASYSKYLSNANLVALIQLIEELQIASENFLVNRFYQQVRKVGTRVQFKYRKGRDGTYVLLENATGGWKNADHGNYYPGDEANLLKQFEPLVSELPILVMCLQGVFKGINDVVDSWGGAILANPALSRLF